MSRRFFFLLLLAGPALWGQPDKEAKYPQGLPASLAGFADDGTLVLYLNEDRLGVVQMGWKRDGSLENRITISFAGQSYTRTTRVTPDAEGRWQKLAVDLPGVQVTAEREGTSVRRTVKERTSTSVTRQDAVVFDNNGLGMVSHAIRRYDRAKGGVQSFPLLVLGGGGTEAVLELQEKAVRTVAGRDLNLAKFKYNLAGLDLFVWADEEGRAYLIDVPAQKTICVREGYEALRKPPADDPTVSRAEFDIEEIRNADVPMRDGLKLKADVYKPKGVEKAPAILVRTPYKKELNELQGRFYARRGYVYAVEDVRGRFGSPGVWEPFVNEPKDGYDTVEWLAGQPYTNGKVGMIGASYLGWVQWWTASQRPPHLVTIIPNVAPPDPFYNIPYEYGAFFVAGAIWWAQILEENATADISASAIIRISDKRFSKVLNHLPVIELDTKILGKENRYWRRWIQHPTNDAYWAQASHLDKLKNVRIPVFHQSGWFDGDGIGSKLNYLAMARHGHPNQKLVLGPWGHSDSASRSVGGEDYGEAAVIDLQRDYLRWFDYWLKGRDSGILKEPLVSLFVMGSNKWVHGPAYPLPRTQFTKIYLASGGNANTSKGDGKLAFTAPASGTPPDRYTYDPGDPTPDPRLYEESEENEKKVRSAEERWKEAREYHNKITEARKDMLVYLSDPLEKDLSFAGPISAVLYAASSAKDTDWFVWLHAVEPEGRIHPLALGKIRARFRKSLSKPELLKPGEVHPYTLDLWHTGMTLKKGWRLRVEVASSAFPIFSRNLNTGGHNEMETRYLKADQTVHHDARRPSHILLPVIPAP